VADAYGTRAHLGRIMVTSDFASNCLLGKTRPGGFTPKFGIISVAVISRQFGNSGGCQDQGTTVTCGGMAFAGGPRFWGSQTPGKAAWFGPIDGEIGGSTNIVGRWIVDEASSDGLVEAILSCNSPFLSLCHVPQKVNGIV